MTSSGGDVVVDRIRTDDGVLQCRVSASGAVRRFFAEEEFVTSYGRSLDDVPRGLLAVPALAQVCPVAWTTGATVHVDTVDERFMRALRAVESELSLMYPKFVEGGDLAYDVATRPHPDGTREGTGLLFSGGVDSMASYVRRQEEDPTLISVQGWVIDVDAADQWAETAGHIQQFADRHDLETRFVRSNMLSVLDTPMLNAHFKRYVDGSWYSAVGHGLGLLGLCAPLSWADDLGRLYVAATHTAAFDVPWGSHPRIDENVAWTGTEAVHDGYELSRQEKVELLADFVRQEAPSLQLRTCTRADDGGNCSACEKCYRTITGLVLAGLDPNDHGYEVDPETFPKIRAGLESGDWIMGEDERFMWEDIQRHVPPMSTGAADGDGPRLVAAGQTRADGDGGVQSVARQSSERGPRAVAAREFFDWLADADVRAMAERANPPLRHTVLRAVARNVPYPVYTSLYPVFDRAKRVVR